uniref:WAP domain-containing protein n=1 Tax=Strongyloides papillosus TaxID=174720 RepID=A0A0N5BE73_STREA
MIHIIAYLCIFSCDNTNNKIDVGRRSEIRQSPKSYRIDTVTIQPPTLKSIKHDDGDVRIKEVKCPSVCMPKCTTKCLKAYMFINNPNYPFYMDPNRYSLKSISESVPLCHPLCMPKCSDTCLSELPSDDSLPSTNLLCRQACMPKCSPVCVASPPSIIPCERPLLNPNRCDCSPGYVQCSEATCCMRYKKMAIKYRNLLPSYLDADDEKMEKKFDKDVFSFVRDGLVPDYINGNETNIYINFLRRLGGSDKDNNEKLIKNSIFESEGSGTEV